MTECLNGGKSSGHSFPPQTKALAMSQSKEWSASKLWPSGWWPHKWNERDHGPPCPALGHWGEGISFPQKILGELGIIEW